MNILSWLKIALGWHKKQENMNLTAQPTMGKGMLVFANTAEVIKAEQVLREAGFDVEIKGPPPSLQSGCDMVLVFPLLHEPAVLNILEGQVRPIRPLQVLPLSSVLLEPVDLFHSRTYGDFLMVRAANMKLVVDTKPDRNGMVVNVSGGGCPDVPHVASLLMNKFVQQAVAPIRNGKTLCVYSLQKAYEEVLRVLASPESLASLRSKEEPPQAVGNPCVLPQKFQRNSPRSWLICSTVPHSFFPLTYGTWNIEGKELVAQNSGPKRLPIQRGSTSLIAVATMVCHHFGCPAPKTLLVGDIGDGTGSRALYQEFAMRAGNSGFMPQGVTFHYLFPDVDGHNQVLIAINASKTRPLMVADAGYMYVAKMSGYADEYDVFTPDAGEMAFLGDEEAPHPFYTRGFLLAKDDDIPELVERAHHSNNSAHYLLVKGACDRIASQGKILHEITQPLVPNMEPVGGTGDLVTGLLTGFLACGFEVEAACVMAAQCARNTGALAKPQPDSQIAEILEHVPEALKLL